MTDHRIPPPIERIVVVGSTGSGKSTLARQLAALLDLPHVELDALHWDAGWASAPRDVFRERVSLALASDRWVVDGNYSQVRDLVWPVADTVVWLDYRLPLILARLLRRQTRRLLKREVLWNDNVDSWREQFGRESLFLWAIQTYRRRRHDYPAELQQPQHRHLRIYRFRTPRATRRWLRELAADRWGRATAGW